MGRKLNEVRPRPITVADLNVDFLIWTAIPMAFINRLINSVYSSCIRGQRSWGGGGGGTRCIDS